LDPGTIVVSQLWATRSAHLLFDRNTSCKYIEFVHYVDNTVISPYPWTMREFTMVYNSNDTKERALKIGNWLQSKPSFLLPPIIELPQTDYSIRTNWNEYNWITLVNFNKDKGADIFNQLASIDHLHKYVGIKGSHGTQEVPVTQVELLNPTFDMEQIWKNTRILVVLSTYETWSMVASEAMMRGIPVVAANHIPALKENCGDAALYVDRTNLTECISAFQQIEANYEYYSKKSREQSKPPNYAQLLHLFS
jgi:glycosyltransferase involved in cell wall biosynthesis